MRISRFLSQGFLFQGSLMLLLTLSSVAPVQAEELYPYIQTFRISAYYSPCEGQVRYATGSYEGDIRLNGNGTNGADGTQVYPGMIAAPKTYAFATKMSIPGIGITAVHDRGGAIVPAGERGQSYDRLDVWMGWCDDGLNRALNWGLRTVDVTVYGIDDSIQESVYLEGFIDFEQAVSTVVKQVIVAPELFPDDLWYLSSGEDVQRLQTYLKELGFYAGEISGYYGEETREAVYQFQLAQGIVSSWDDFGAGHTGVNTRAMLDLAVSKLREEEEAESLQKVQQGLLLLPYHPDLDRNRTTFVSDLTLGASGDDVRRLQEELRTLGYLRMDPTGYYGEMTEHAVFKFQQKQGLIAVREDLGAGVFGPKTRGAMNRIVESRTHELSLIAYQREQHANATVASTPGTESGTFTRVLAFGDHGAEVKALQSLLKQLGHFQGAFVTEFYGEQTQAAVLAFQLANGLVSSESDAGAGQVTEATLALLNTLS